MILLTPLVVLAFQAQAEQVRRDELKSKSFTAGSLKITLRLFGVRLYDGSFRPMGNSNIEIDVENTSGDFTTFAPQSLMFIDKDDNQVNIVGQYATAEWRLVAAGDKRIWPKARIKPAYSLTNKLQLPARLYYEDKLLATIIE